MFWEEIWKNIRIFIWNFFLFFWLHNFQYIWIGVFSYWSDGMTKDFLLPYPEIYFTFQLMYRKYWPLYTLMGNLPPLHFFSYPGSCSIGLGGICSQLPWNVTKGLSFAVTRMTRRFLDGADSLVIYKLSKLSEVSIKISFKYSEEKIVFKWPSMILMTLGKSGCNVTINGVFGFLGGPSARTSKVLIELRGCTGQMDLCCL